MTKKKRPVESQPAPSKETIAPSIRVTNMSREAYVGPGGVLGAWVTECSQRKPKWKHALAHHTATHLIQYGDVIQLGSGTTFNSLMEKIIELQESRKKAYDLIILTTNLQVLAKGRDAQARDPMFSATQIVLTGGALQVSLESLTGEYAAKGVRYAFINPRTVFLGAAGLTFNEKLSITYQFQDEISTQIAYATRPTKHRVILCDHSKLGTRAAWDAELTIDSLLQDTNECTIVSTLPDKDDPEDGKYVRTIEQEQQAFQNLIEPLASNKDYAEKKLAFRLIDAAGEVKWEHSLTALREQRTKKSTKS
jgi:hypothetical protein